MSDTTADCPKCSAWVAAMYSRSIDHGPDCSIGKAFAASTVPEEARPLPVREPSEPGNPFVKDARRALRCLHIAVEESTARDVQTKVEAAIASLESEIARLSRELEETRRIGENLASAAAGVLNGQPRQGQLGEAILAWGFHFPETRKDSGVLPNGR